MSELLIEKHIKYFSLCLNILPSKFQDQDNNKLSLIYFCLQSLQILNDLNFTKQEKIEFSNSIIDSYYIGNGFRSIMNSMGNDYDKPSISSTFFGLSNLISLETPINDKIDRFKIMDFLKNCQIKSGLNKGSFTTTLNINNEPFGETDLRICYMAICIRKYLKIDLLSESERLKTDFDVKSLIDYILDKLNYNGGFSCDKISESHLGYTYCAIASLKLLNFNFDNKNKNNHRFDINKTINWIVHRQINYPEILYDENDKNFDHADFGGFNGRENKPSDSCYSWWSLGSLSILNKLELANLKKLESFLLIIQDHRTGGFGKNFDASPDPYHSFLSLSSLAIIKDYTKFVGYEKLNEFDTIMSITKSLVDFFESLNWH